MAKRVQSVNTIPGGRLNNFLNTFSEKILNFKRSKTIYIIALIAIILILAMYKKNWFIAATVNNSPLTNLELQSKLNQQFRTQTLNQLINEKIILGEAAKSGAIPTEEEINKKISELETNVGGKDMLDNLLAQQGQTRQTLRDQIRVQLAIAKLYDKEATISADEVTKFIEQNKEVLKATDSANQQKEAGDTLKQQKLSQIFSQKFQELRQKAKIQIF
ncbi:MAG: PpiC-type peptidyl-prolyl cis-trans isomerase [Microgenomates group bacterium Gr01-1014_7]|nr:MAG: PpiC-type peptidyl-prolyl cis-trans isomerase [Microgenomates group bacterium Gr01-1014_7]